MTTSPPSDRCYVNDAGLPTDESGRILIGAPPDSAAYCAFHSAYRRTLTELMGGVSPQFDEHLAKLNTLIAAMTDAGEREDARTGIARLREIHERASSEPVPTEKYQRARDLRTAAEFDDGPGAEQRIRATITEIADLASGTPAEERDAILGESERLWRLLRDRGGQV